MSLRILFAALLSFPLFAAVKPAVLCAPCQAPKPMIDAWEALGWQAVTEKELTKDHRIVAIFQNGLDIPPPAVQRIASLIPKGVHLYLSAGKGGQIPEPLRQWMPANDWSLKPPLARTGCNLSMPGLPPIPISRRFDLHLPGSSIESPMFRYRPSRYLRDTNLVQSISVLARTIGDEGLPALLEASANQSRILLFAGDFTDRQLTESPAGNAFLAAVARRPAQPRLPNQAPIPTRPDEWAMQDAWREFDISIEEDETNLAELPEALRPPEGINGITAFRYIYRPGTSPRIRLRLRNHFNNIAPLAKAKDIIWPGNPSAAGLNDSAYTHASVRGKLPIHAVWCAKSAASQRIALEWPFPVHLGAVRITSFGPYRHWDRNRPNRFTLAADGVPFLLETTPKWNPSSTSEEAIFESRLNLSNAFRTLTFCAEGLDSKRNGEPRFSPNIPSNCGLVELEAFGWPGARETSSVRAILEVERIDLSTESKERNTLTNINLSFCSEATFSLDLYPRNSFGPVHWRFRLLDTNTRRLLAEKDFDAFFIPASGNKLIAKKDGRTAEPGLLCTPGWRNADSFGLGMRKWTQGWGGVHDKLWAASLDLTEQGLGTKDTPSRMFASAANACHYTNPWRRFPNGDWAWSPVENWLRESISPGGRWYREGRRNLHVVGSDRWNGVPINCSFAWDDFVRFDHWLKKEGKPGLRAKSRRGLIEEVCEEYGDLWQRFQLEGYADYLLGVQNRFSKLGVPFHYETHGSFPFAGGKLGKKLGQTHRGVGTDVFWELMRQDLWFTLGQRFAVVAVNPDLESGAYGQWGWVNSEQNEFWFASNGDIPSARRQWYATYFMGRINTQGKFRPYHELGYGYQGSHGVRYTVQDHMARCRVQNLVSELRPEDAAGIGLVVSWNSQLKRMGKQAGRMGFGLYSARGNADLSDLFRVAYAALVKQGVPISFVTSTEALKKWKGSQPLVLLDTAHWEPWELDLARNATVRGARTFAFPARPNLSTAEAVELARQVKKVLCPGLDCPPGVALIPFISHGKFFLSVCRLGDASEGVRITIRPSELAPLSTPPSRVISLDDGCTLDLERRADGTISFTCPLEPYSAKLLMLP